MTLISITPRMLGERPPLEKDKAPAAATVEASEHTERNTAIFPPAAVAVNFDVVVVLRDPRHALGKHFTIDEAGGVKKDAKVSVAFAEAVMRHVPTPDSLADVLREVTDDPHAALVLDPFIGVRVDEPFVILSEAQLARLLGVNVSDRQALVGVHRLMINGAERSAVARLKENFRPGAWALLDRDVCQYTPAEFAGGDYNEWLAQVDRLLPGVAAADRVAVGSSSQRVLRNGVPVGQGNGHTFIKLDDPSNRGQLKVALRLRSMHMGMAWKKPKFAKDTGQQCGSMDATVIDLSTFDIGRLVFEGKPTTAAGLEVISANITVQAGAARVVDTSSISLPAPDEVRRISREFGSELRISGSGDGLKLDAFDLQLHTELDLADHGLMTVEAAMQLLDGKHRCQAPFRASESYAACLNFSAEGRPVVHDVGTGTNHWLCDEDWLPIRDQALDAEFVDAVLTPAEQAEQALVRERNERRRDYQAAAVEQQAERALIERDPTAFELARRQHQKEENRRIGEGQLVVPRAEQVSLQAALGRFVFCSDGSRVADAFAPHYDLPFPDWAATYAASVEHVPQPAKKVGDKEVPQRDKVQPVPSLWKAHPERKTVVGRTFKAGGGLVVADPDGRTCLNTWRPFDRSGQLTERDHQKAQAFFDHVEWLFAAEASRFLDWLAHIEQQPGVLPHTAWLHVARSVGMGRNWLASVLTRVWAGAVAANVNLPELLGSGFNGVLSRKVLAIVDEIREGARDTHWQHSETLKSVITAETRLVNPKYGRQSREFNACRWLMFSNFESALPLESGDRRVEVVMSEERPRPEAYYRGLYALLDDQGFIAAVADRLARRPLALFNPGAVAKLTDAKRAVVQASISPMAEWCQRVLELWPADIIKSSDLHQVLVGEAGGGNAMGSAVRRTLEQFSVKPMGRTVKVDNSPVRLSVIRNHDRWLEAPPDAMRAELKKVSAAAELLELSALFTARELLEHLAAEEGERAR